jgi:hypothetical protein
LKAQESPSVYDSKMTLGWTNNVMTVSDPRLPNGSLEIWYLEAFCRDKGWDREWNETTLPHRTHLVESDRTGKRLIFLTQVQGGLEVRHEVKVVADGVEFRFELTNSGSETAPVQWFQPACIRVGDFTGKDQETFISRSFLKTAEGWQSLDQLERTTQARYLGGQVYIPKHTRAQDANPRPICKDQPVEGLIGCWSMDNRWLLAVASDRTHELFEGVYVCLHSDPRIDGVAPGETKRIFQKLYLIENDMDVLLAGYRKDFPEGLRP